MSEAPVRHPLIHFEKRFLGTRTEGIFMRLDDWVARCAPGATDMLLQMDIEGAEYGVLASSDESLLSRFRIIIVEFHHLDHLCSRLGFELIDAAFAKLTRLFDIVHVHPNNCAAPVAYHQIRIPPVMEFTFLRKDRITCRHPVSDLPHALDRTSMPNRPDHPLPACWYR